MKKIDTKPKFLVCVNDKEHSRIALKFACTKAKWGRNLVEMLYIIDPIDYNTLFSVADVIKEERRAEAKKLLAELEKQAIEWCGMKPVSIIREGRIADEIFATIDEDPYISLLLVGASADGSTGKKGIITQLTSEIGSKYHIPLVIVPGNLTDQQIEELN